MNLAIPKNMKFYPVGFFLPGPRFEELSDKSVPANAALQAEHLEAVRRNIESGEQIMAVPMTDGAPVVAIAVYRPNLSADAVAALLRGDPAVAAGRFSFQVHSAFFPSLETIKVEY